MAVASEAIPVRATKKTERFSAILIPMSRTCPALSAYSTCSVRGFPKSLTSRAPATLKRSFIRVPRSAFSDICSCVRDASRLPMTRAGRMKKGTSARAPSVRGHDRVSIVPTMTTSEMALLTTFWSTEVKACWAPMTSLLSRVTRAPVWARVKNATGWRSTWPKTSARRS